MFFMEKLENDYVDILSSGAMDLGPVGSQGSDLTTTFPYPVV